MLRRHMLTINWYFFCLQITATWSDDSVFKMNFMSAPSESVWGLDSANMELYQRYLPVFVLATKQNVGWCAWPAVGPFVFAWHHSPGVTAGSVCGKQLIRSKWRKWIKSCCSSKSEIQMSWSVCGLGHTGSSWTVFRLRHQSTVFRFTCSHSAQSDSDVDLNDL